MKPLPKWAWATLAFAYGLLFGAVLSSSARSQELPLPTIPAYSNVGIGQGWQDYAVRALCPANPVAPVELRITTMIDGAVYSERNCINGRIGLSFRMPGEPNQLSAVKVEVLSTRVYPTKLRRDYDCPPSPTIACYTTSGTYDGVVTYAGDVDWIAPQTQHWPFWITTTTRPKCYVSAVPTYANGAWWIVVTGGPAGCAYSVKIYDFRNVVPLPW